MEQHLGLRLKYESFQLLPLVVSVERFIFVVFPETPIIFFQVIVAYTFDMTERTSIRLLQCRDFGKGSRFVAWEVSSDFAAVVERCGLKRQF